METIVLLHEHTITYHDMKLDKEGFCNIKGKFIDYAVNRTVNMRQSVLFLFSLEKTNVIVTAIEMASKVVKIKPIVVFTGIRMTDSIHIFPRSVLLLEGSYVRVVALHNDKAIMSISSRMEKMTKDLLPGVSRIEVTSCGIFLKRNADLYTVVKKDWEICNPASWSSSSVEPR